jgi:glycosyltransferase involved in cell wall biosynthesis
MNKKVSVIIPSYNCEKYIGTTIKSVLNQSYNNFEVIITDDCSTDKSTEEISRYSDKRIKLFKFGANMGISAAINNCIKQSSGAYLALLGSDDTFRSDKLKKQVEYLEKHKDVAAIFTQVKLINENGGSFIDADHLYDSFNTQENKSRYEWLRYFFLNKNVLCASSSMIRATCQSEIGQYDNRLLQLQDLDMWIRTCMKYEIHILPEELTEYRIRQNLGNISSHTLENQSRLKLEQLIVLQNYFHIRSSREFNHIFPEGINEKYGDKTSLSFSVAIQALAVESNVHQLFGMTKLYELLSDAKSRSILKREFNFSYPQLYKYAGRNDLFDLTNFHKITSSKFFKLWQYIKNPKWKMSLTLLGMLKKAKYSMYLLSIMAFDLLIKLLINLHAYRLAASVYACKKQVQIFFYSDCLDVDNQFIKGLMLIPLTDYIKKHNINKEIHEPSNVIQCFPPHYVDDTKRNPVLITQPESYTAQLHNVQIIGGSSIILKDESALLEEVNYFPFTRIDLSSATIREHYKHSILIDSYKSYVTIKKGIMLSGTASYNYYHWLLEYLPKFYLINKSKYNRYPLIVDEVILNTPQLKETLDTFKNSGIQILPLKSNHMYSVEDLIYVSPLSWTVINIQKNLKIKSTDSFTSPVAVHYLRNKLTSNIQLRRRKKIYIKRGGAPNRKFNEQDVIALCKKYEYEIIDPSLLSFREQVDHFSQAKIIVGTSGAGLTNILFAPKGVKILCLKNSKIDLSVFSNIAGILDQKMVFLDGIIDPNDSSPYYYQKGFTVDLKKFELALQHIEGINMR